MGGLVGIPHPFDRFRSSLLRRTGPRGAREPGRLGRDPQRAADRRRQRTRRRIRPRQRAARHRRVGRAHGHGGRCRLLGAATATPQRPTGLRAALPAGSSRPRPGVLRRAGVHAGRQGHPARCAATAGSRRPPRRAATTERDDRREPGRADAGHAARPSTATRNCSSGESVLDVMEEPPGRRPARRDRRGALARPPGCGSRGRSSRSLCRCSCWCCSSSACRASSSASCPARSSRPTRPISSRPCVIYYLGFPLRGLRWSILLRGAGAVVRVIDATEIIFISWLVNCLVPAKLGDIYRAYLLKINSDVSLSRTFGTVFIERILDLFAIVTARPRGGVRQLPRRA